MALASAMHEVVHLDLERLRRPTRRWTGRSEDLLDFLAREGGPVAEVLFFNLEDARQEVQGLVNYPGVRSVLTDIYQASIRVAVSQGRAARPVRPGLLSLLRRLHRTRATSSAASTSGAQQALADAYSGLLEAAAAGNAARGGRTCPRPARDRPQPRTAHQLSRRRAPKPRSGWMQKADAEAAADGADMVRLPSPIGAQHRELPRRPAGRPRHAPVSPIARAPPNWPATPPPINCSASARPRPSTSLPGWGESWS